MLSLNGVFSKGKTLLPRGADSFILELIPISHYENMPIQIHVYWNFTTKNWKFLDKNSDIFS